MVKIVVVGSLNMDLVAVATRLPAAGETLLGTYFSEEPGGKGANQAYAAGRLGGEVAMLGCIGADQYGRQLRKGLAEVCDVAAVRSVEGSSGIAVIVVAGSGQNTIVVVPGANHRYRPSDLLAANDRLRDARLLLLQLETPLETVIEAARMAKQYGARVILDPAPASASLPKELLRNVDILTPNEVEAAQLVSSPPGRLNLEEASAISHKIRTLGVNTVIIKLGAQGCLLADSNATTVIAAPPVDVLDTTSAGDVFNGALAVAISEGRDLAQACRFAVHAAALSVTRRGSQRSMPTRPEVEAFMQRAA